MYKRSSAAGHWLPAPHAEIAELTCQAEVKQGFQSGHPTIVDSVFTVFTNALPNFAEALARIMSGCTEPRQEPNRVTAACHFRARLQASNAELQLLTSASMPCRSMLPRR